METIDRQVLLDQFIAELVLLPDEYLYYFFGIVASFRKQIEVLDKQKALVENPIEDLEAGYRCMAADQTRENEANEWIEATLNHVEL